MRSDVTQFANLEAERAALGAILLDERGAQYDVAVGLGLSAGDFSISSHCELFQTIASLLDGGGAVDLVTLVNHLTDARRLEALGGAGYVSALLDGARSRSIKGSVKIVREKAAKRRTATACEAAKSALGMGEASRKVIGALEEDLRPSRRKRRRLGDAGPSLHRCSVE
jgi:replicative DNA helicase